MSTDAVQINCLTAARAAKRITAGLGAGPQGISAASTYQMGSSQALAGLGPVLHVLSWLRRTYQQAG